MYDLRALQPVEKVVNNIGSSILLGTLDYLLDRLEVPSSVYYLISLIFFSLLPPSRLNRHQRRHLIHCDLSCLSLYIADIFSRYLLIVHFSNCVHDWHFLAIGEGYDGHWVHVHWVEHWSEPVLGVLVRWRAVVAVVYYDVDVGVPEHLKKFIT